ncbi:Peptidase family M48 family protein [Euphorbia peplus]|nr:Peptidase family M48 family protein [Euphorbia peplus]
MQIFKKSKLAIHAIRCYASKSSLHPPTSTINQFSPSSCKSSQFYPSSSSAILNRFILPSKIRKNHTQFLGTRYYYVDRNQVHHFKPRGPNSLLQNLKIVVAVVCVASGVFISVYFGNLENVPYTKRTHFVLLPKSMERKLGEDEFKKMKRAFKGKILPAIHPESVRVRLISKQVIEALQRGLKNEQIWTDMNYASADGGFGNADETLKVLMGDSQDIKWSKEDEILDDKWIQETRKKAHDKGTKAETSHLDRFNWEVLVVDEPVVNAFCLPGGKIVVFTGLFDLFKTDAEIATIIGHEVAHAVARHTAEALSKNLWFAILQLVLIQYAPRDIVTTMSSLFLRLPFSRRMELEADYIGLFLMASAGYDPRVAPRVYEKLGKLEGGESLLRDYLSTHPSGKKRAKLLAQAKVMEEALAIYRETVSGNGIEGFFL